MNRSNSIRRASPKFFPFQGLYWESFGTAHWAKVSRSSSEPSLAVQSPERGSHSVGQ